MRILILPILALCFACSQPAGQEKVLTWDTTAVEDNAGDNTTQKIMPGDRQSWLNPDLVLEKLGNLKDKTVADIGAGTGYFTFRLADRGANVIAIDIDEDYLAYIRDRREQFSSVGDLNIETRLSPPDSPSLEPNEAGIVLLVNTYTYLPDRITYLKDLYTGMTKDGLICIVDYKSENIPVISKDTPLLDPSIVMTELQEAGFSGIELDSTSLEFQYIITAKKR